MGPGLKYGGAEGGGVDLLGQGAALGQGGEAELEVLAAGAQGRVDG